MADGGQKSKHGPKLEDEKKAHKSTKRENEPDVTDVEVLLLTFDYHDISSVDRDITAVTKAFEKLKYSVKEEKIAMKDSPNNLKGILEEFLPKPDPKKPDPKKSESKVTPTSQPKNPLYIIYYNGHGYLNTQAADGQFTIASHNYPDSHELRSQLLLVPKVFDEMGTIFGLTPEEQRLKWEEARKKFGKLLPIAEVPWEDISDTIMDAPCNTLVILDCCHAGLASAMGRFEAKEDFPFRKELLAACTWGDKTQSRMSPALCDVLEKIFTDGDMSVWTVVREMNEILVKKFLENKKKNKKTEVPQAVHFVLRRTQRDRILLNRLKSRKRDQSKAPAAM